MTEQQLAHEESSLADSSSISSAEVTVLRQACQKATSQLINIRATMYLKQQEMDELKKQELAAQGEVRSLSVLIHSLEQE